MCLISEKKNNYVSTIINNEENYIFNRYNIQHWPFYKYLYKNTFAV